MTAEPKNIRTAFGNAAPPILPERTVDDYRADLIRKFGKVPSRKELAALENVAMRKKTQQSRLGGYHRTKSHADQARRALALVNHAVSTKPRGNLTFSSRQSRTPPSRSN